MFKKVLILLLTSVTIVSAAKYHTDARSAEIHTPFRWIVADSTAKAALSLAAADTQKFCLQLSDTSIWCLIDNSPLNWAFISGKKADSLNLRTFVATTAGITRINIDSSDHRIITADSATIPIFKGNETHRGVVTFNDSSYFASGLRGLRLYFPQADIDSMVGNVQIGGYLSVWGGNAILRGIASNTIGSSTAPLIYFESPTTEDYSMLQQGEDTLNLYTFTGATWYKRIGICSDGNVKFTGALTTATLDADSIKINGGSYLNAYVTGSFACTLKTSDVTVQQIGTAYYTKIGNVFTCSFPYLAGTSNSTSLRIYCHFPYVPRQLATGDPTEFKTMTAVDNGSPTLCYIPATDVSGYVGVYIPGGTFTGSGNKGVYPFTINFIAED